MLRDNLAGLIEPMRAARELNPLALFTEQKKSSDDRPRDALKIPAPKGRNLTLTENAASPFHAEPRQTNFFPLIPSCALAIDLLLYALGCTYRRDSRSLNRLNGRRHDWANPGRTDRLDIQGTGANRSNLSVHTNTSTFSCICFADCQKTAERQSKDRETLHVFHLDYHCGYDS